VDLCGVLPGLCIVMLLLTAYLIITINFVFLDIAPAATLAVPDSVFIAMSTGDATPEWFEVNLNPSFYSYTLSDRSTNEEN